MATPETEVSSIQDKEISVIRSKYPEQIEVLSRIGEFQNVVILNFKDLDLQLKFQLTDEYPNSAASVSVRSTTCSHNQQDALNNHLQAEAELKKGKPIVQHLTNTALKWLEDNSIYLKCSVDGKTDTINEKRKDSKKEKKSKKGNGNTDKPEYNSSSTPGKKSAMETAAEVIFRREEDDGIMEESDGAVGGLCMVENNADHVLEIPMKELSIQKPVRIEKNHETTYHTEKKTGHRNTRQRPNFFLSLDITNENVRKNAKKVQEILSYRFPNYADHIEPESTFHITLAVMNLEDTHEISHCSKFLKDMEPELAALAKKIPPLNLRGVGNFGEGIIFARVEFSSEFWGFVKFVTERLRDADVHICQERDYYTPHLTLVKCPGRMIGKASHEEIARCIDPLKNIDFGAQKLDSVHLYKMGRKNNKYTEAAVITF